MSEDCKRTQKVPVSFCQNRQGYGDFAVGSRSRFFQLPAAELVKAAGGLGQTGAAPPAEVGRTGGVRVGEGDHGQRQAPEQGVLRQFINDLTGKDFKNWQEMYDGVPFLDVEDISDMVFWLGTSRSAGKFSGRDLGLDLGTLQQ